MIYDTNSRNKIFKRQINALIQISMDLKSGPPNSASTYYLYNTNFLRSEHAIGKIEHFVTNTENVSTNES